jgi:hypothetical protein
VLAQVACNPEPGRASDPGADRLNRDHQRITDDQRPTQTERELRAGLGVRGYPTRVVVGSPGDEPGAQELPRTRLTRSARPGSPFSGC